MGVDIASTDWQSEESFEMCCTIIDIYREIASQEEISMG